MLTRIRLLPLCGRVMPVSTPVRFVWSVITPGVRRACMVSPCGVVMIYDFVKVQSVSMVVLYLKTLRLSRDFSKILRFFKVVSVYESNEIAERIKALAKARGLALSKMLASAGLSYNTMTGYRTSVPKADNLAKIADVLNCSVDYLLGRTDNPEINRL